MATLQTRGLSAEEAFLIATRRIGQTRQLESEFGKLNRNTIWLDRAMWMLIGIQVWPFFDRLTSGIAGGLFALGWKTEPRDFSSGVISRPVLFSALIQLPALVVAVWLTWKVLRNSGKVGQWVAKQLPERFSFVLCCVIVSSLAFLLYALVILLPSWLDQFYLLPLIPNQIPMRVRAAIGISESLIAPVRLIGFTVLTLLIARKQFAPKKPPLEL